MARHIRRKNHLDDEGSDLRRQAAFRASPTWYVSQAINPIAAAGKSPDCFAATRESGEDGGCSLRHQVGEGGREGRYTRVRGVKQGALQPFSGRLPLALTTA